jgi:hypothetical protein
MILVLAYMFCQDGFSSVSYQSVSFKQFAVGCGRKSTLLCPKNVVFPLVIMEMGLPPVQKIFVNSHY